MTMDDDETKALALNRVQEGSLLPDMKPAWKATKMDVLSQYPSRLPTPRDSVSHGYIFEITGSIPQSLDRGFHGGPVDMDALGIWMNAQAYFGGRVEAEPEDVTVETYSFDWIEVDGE